MPDKSAAVRHREVLADEAGQRIDNFLVRELKGVPKGHVYRLLRTGQVRVNRGRVKPHYRLQAGDSVRLPPVRTTPPTSAKPSRELTDRLEAAVIFEDRRLLAVNKPAGLAVHGGSGLSLGVIEALRQARPDAPYLELVHRLDRETSGCLLIAKRRSELRALHALLREGGMEKHYLALVAGRWEQGEREVSMHLRKNEVRSGERMVTVDESGKASTSRFRPVAFYADATLLEVEILTGRTHQIRVHAAESGHPVVGDDKYGDREVNRHFRKLGCRRMCLHAQRLGFVRPGTDERLELSAPLDGAFRQVLDRLEAEHE